MRYLLLLVMMLTACAEVEKREPEAQAPVTADVADKKPESRPLKYLAGRKLAPIPTRPLNVQSRCAHRDAEGTLTKLDLLVKNAEVQTFRAEVHIPRRGHCRFNMQQFSQRQKLPQVLLAARDGSSCTVRMWEEPRKQGSRITIAFNSCPAACEGNTFEYLWPIMVDSRTGRCF